jgi:hypothetical protein
MKSHSRNKRSLKASMPDNSESDRQHPPASPAPVQLETGKAPPSMHPPIPAKPSVSKPTRTSYSFPMQARLRGHIFGVTGADKVYTTLFDPYVHQGWNGSSNSPKKPELDIVRNLMPPALAYSCLSTVIIMRHRKNSACRAIFTMSLPARSATAR